MKKIYIQPDIKVVRIHPNNLLQNVSPPVLKNAGTNIDDLDGYDEDGGDASEAW